VREPLVLASRLAGLTAEQLRVVAGTSELAPDPKDRRFVDSAWSNPVWKRVAQSYLGTREAVLGSVDELDLDEKSADRARFALMQITEAMAPTNVLAGNPAAMKHAVRTPCSWRSMTVRAMMLILTRASSDSSCARRPGLFSRKSDSSVAVFIDLPQGVLVSRKSR